jgi:hypothetical protein
MTSQVGRKFGETRRSKFGVHPLGALLAIAKIMNRHAIFRIELQKRIDPPAAREELVFPNHRLIPEWFARNLQQADATRDPGQVA